MSSMLTPYGTLSFPNLFTPRARAQNTEPVYSASLIFNVAQQNTPEYKALKEACVELARTKFPKDWSRVQLPFRDAGEKTDKYQGYEEGFTFINPWTKRKPGIVDARLQDVLLPEQVYAGQTVRARVSPFSYDTSGNKGISLSLDSIQIVKHDAPRIDGVLPANKAFTAVDADDDEEVPFMLIPRS